MDRIGFINKHAACHESGHSGGLILANMQGVTTEYPQRPIDLAVELANHALLPQERTLKRAIPVLIGIFLVLSGLGIATFLYARHEQTLGNAKNSTSLIADIVEANLARRLGAPLSGSSIPLTPTQNDLAQSLPSGATSHERIILVTDGRGRIRATAPIMPLYMGKRLIEIIGPNQPLTTLGHRAGVQAISLPGKWHANRHVLATVRNITNHTAQIAVLQPQSAALSAWRADFTGFVTFFALSGLMLALMTGAFFWQTGRTAMAEDALKTTSRKLNKALVRGRCGLWDWDLSRGQIYWSSSMFDILDLPFQDRRLSFGEINALTHPDDADLYELAENLAKGSVSQVDMEFRMRHAEGHWVWLRARAEITRSQSDSGPHLVGILVDITEQKILAEMTEQADMRLHDAIENISETFVLWNKNNRLVMCNSKYMQFYELSPEVAKPGARYEDVLSQAREPKVRTSIEVECEKDSGAASFEALLEDGRWLHINERRMSDGSFVSIGTDITSLKRHEEKLLENERQLIGTVTDLEDSRRTLEKQTRQLAELADKLAVEKTRAEAANRSKSDFLANMSHELRTPLNAIIGFSEMMKSNLFGRLGHPKYDEYAGDIFESGHFLLEVIDDILDMSKIEAGRFDVVMEELQLDDLVKDALKIIHPRACEENIHIINKLESNIKVRCDRRAIKQVLLNLFSNAIKFTDSGGRIRITAQSDDSHCRVRIADSGIGIPQKELRRLGQPFAQVESQMTKSRGGSGLGLAISRSLIDLHDGDFHIDSEEGAGTQVYFTLPLA